MVFWESALAGSSTNPAFTVFVFPPTVTVFCQHALERVAQLPDVLDAGQLLHQDVLVVREALGNVLAKRLEVGEQAVQLGLCLQELRARLHQRLRLRPEQDPVDRDERLGQRPHLPLSYWSNAASTGKVAEHGLLLLGQDEPGEPGLLVGELGELQLRRLEARVQLVLRGVSGWPCPWPARSGNRTGSSSLSRRSGRLPLTLNQRLPSNTLTPSTSTDREPDRVYQEVWGRR